MPEITSELVLGVIVALFGGGWMLKDKLPAMNTILSYFKLGKKEPTKVKISNLNKLWEIREDFKPDSVVYENITKAIENLVREENKNVE